MASVKVINLNGEEAGKVTLNKEVFEIEPNRAVLFDALVLFRANSRQGTSKTKRRDEVRGGGKKPWRQKGTGRARQGSIRSPQWRGGGSVFGPSGDQNYKIKQNKKERVLALKSALSIKAKEKKVIVMEQCVLDEFKTKTIATFFNNHQLTGKVMVVVTDDSVNEAFFTSTLNLQNVLVRFVEEVNVYDIVNCDHLVLSKDALKTMVEVING